MSYELVNRITIKKDGVYISSHSNNDTAPFRSHRIPYLSDIYEKDGQYGLDKSIIKSCFGYGYPIKLKGNHPSVKKYTDAIINADCDGVYDKHMCRIKKEYKSLSPEDKMSYDINEYKNMTEKAQIFSDFEEKVRNEMYFEILSYIKN